MTATALVGGLCPDQPHVHAARLTAVFQRSLLSLDQRASLPTNILVVLARRTASRSPLPYSSQSEHVLYGRYWGSDGHYDACISKPAITRVSTTASIPVLAGLRTGHAGRTQGQPRLRAGDHVVGSLACAPGVCRGDWTTTWRKSRATWIATWMRRLAQPVQPSEDDRRTAHRLAEPGDPPRRFRQSNRHE